MPGNSQKSTSKYSNVSSYHFPMKKWFGIEEFGLLELTIKPFIHVCNRHFGDGIPKTML